MEMRALDGSEQPPPRDLALGHPLQHLLTPFLMRSTNPNHLYARARNHRPAGRLTTKCVSQIQGKAQFPARKRLLEPAAVTVRCWRRNLLLRMDIAIGINVDVNPLGARPVQGPRLVAIMKEHGFYWEGRFLRPDVTHFAWIT